MKITDQDIIRTARELCDEQNEQLHVGSWSRRHHFHVPTWFVAIPAAAIIGFVLGIWTKSHTQPDAPLTALTDTVYIKVRETATSSDTANHVVASKTSPTIKRVKTTTTSRKNPSITTGRSVTDDKIRYDLLVKN